MIEEYSLKTLLLGLPSEKDALISFLARHGLGFEEDLSFAVALVNGDDEIVACGGTNDRMLKCFAVEDELRGNNALGRLVSALITHCMERGCFDPMVVTRLPNIPLFENCGFSCVARSDAVGLLEKTPGGVRRFAAAIRRPEDAGKRIGAIVMNANPFTLGHRYLVEQAATLCDLLHVLVVEEDRSAFPFTHRLDLVRQGTADLENVRVSPGGPYIISEATFPRYFLKENDDAAWIQSRLDAAVFAAAIAPALGVTLRFVGTEENDPLTRQYNCALQETLPSHGIALTEISRKTAEGEVISASRVRSILASGEGTDRLPALLPPATLAFLQSEPGREVAEKLRGTH